MAETSGNVVRRFVTAAMGAMLVFGTLALGPAAVAAPGAITTFAGGVGPGPSSAVNVSMSPSGVDVDGAGDVFVADALTGVVRKIDSTGTQTVVAGVGAAGYTGDGGPAVSASLNQPSAVAVDDTGHVYVADTLNNAIREVAGGVVNTIAGTGDYGYAGDGGDAASAQLAHPRGLAVDPTGNVLIADTSNNRVRVVAVSASNPGYPLNGCSGICTWAVGHIYTVVGDGTAGYVDGPTATAEVSSPYGLAVDSAGDIAIADTGNSRIRVLAGSSALQAYGTTIAAGNVASVAGNGTNAYSTNGIPAVTASLGAPTGVELVGSGNLVIADTGTNRVRVVAAFSGPFYKQTMTAGYIYTIAGNGTVGFAGDGGLATAAELSSPSDAVVDSSGSVLIADAGNNRLREVSNRGNGSWHITTVGGNGSLGYSGDGGPAGNAQLTLQLSPPSKVAVDTAGDRFISDTANNVVRVVAAGSKLYKNTTTPGDIYGFAGDGIAGYGGDGGPATAASFDGPSGLAVDPFGNVFIADTYNHRIRMVAAVRGTLFGVRVVPGYVYTVAGDGVQCVAGQCGDGGAATTAELDSPSGVAIDGSGNLLIADTFTNSIRVVAASSGQSYGRSMNGGAIYRLAGDGTGSVGDGGGDGGPATSASLFFPYGLAVDGSGNVIVADTYDHRVRVLAVSDSNPGYVLGGCAGTCTWAVGDVYTVAGNGTAGFSGDSGAATSAALDTPLDVSISGTAAFLIADSANNRVRAVTGGVISTVAGNGTPGFSGDGGPATGSELDSPSGVALDGSGNLLIADSGNNRIRQVSGG